MSPQAELFIQSLEKFGVFFFKSLFIISHRFLEIMSFKPSGFSLIGCECIAMLWMKLNLCADLILYTITTNQEGGIIDNRNGMKWDWKISSMHMKKSFLGCFFFQCLMFKYFWFYFRKQATIMETYSNSPV